MPKWEQEAISLDKTNKWESEAIFLDSPDFESFDSDQKQDIRDTLFYSTLNDSDPNDVFPYIKEIKQNEKGSRYEDFSKRLSSGLASVGSAIANYASKQGNYYIPSSGGIAPILPKQEEKIQKITQEGQRELAKSADFLWRITNDPSLAMTHNDLFAKASGMIAETLPYILATTAGGLMAGPAGAFGVGTMVEGNNTYRSAQDYFREQNGGQPLTQEQEIKAQKLGVAGGLAKGAIEGVGFGGVSKLFNIVSGKLKSKLLTGVVDFTAATISEALEEGSQELVDVGLEKTYKDVDWNEAVTRTLGAMAGGAFLGGAVKGGGIAFRQSMLMANEKPAKIPEEYLVKEDTVSQPTESVTQTKQTTTDVTQASTPAVEPQTIAEGEVGTKKIKVIPAQKVIDKIISNTEGEPNRKAINKKIHNESEMWQEVEIPIDSITGLEGGVASEAKPEKGSIVLDKNNVVIDGRHRVLQAKESGQTTIKALVPIQSQPTPPVSEPQTMAEGGVGANKWYHGTRKDFKEFSFDKLSADLGIYFTKDKSYAEKYTTETVHGEGTPRVIEKDISPKKTLETRFGQQDNTQIGNVIDSLILRATKLAELEDIPKSAAGERAIKKLNQAKIEMLEAQTIDEWKSGEAKLYDASMDIAKGEGVTKPFSTLPLREELINLGYDSVRKLDDGADTLVVLKPEIIQSQPIPPVEAQPTVKENLTVETEKIKTAQLAERTEALAIEKNLTKNLGELPTYETMNMQEQADLASQELQNFDRAFNIAMGKEMPTNSNLRPASVYEAVKYRLVQQGDIDRLRTLATQSTIPSELSKLGQQIKAADVGREEDAVKGIQTIAKTREEVYTKRNKKDIKKVKKEIAKSIKEEIKKASTILTDWESFISDLQC